MGTSVQEIKRWFERGVEDNATHMIVVCDTFDWEDFPVYVSENEDFYSVYNKYTGGQNMARIMEVYDLHMNKEEQLDGAGRVHNLPNR